MSRNPTPTFVTLLTYISKDRLRVKVESLSNGNDALRTEGAFSVNVGNLEKRTGAGKLLLRKK